MQNKYTYDAMAYVNAAFGNHMDAEKVNLLARNMQLLPRTAVRFQVLDTMGVAASLCVPSSLPVPFTTVLMRVY